MLLFIIYINGSMTVNKTFSTIMPPTISRSSCYIGKSNWAGDGYSDSYLDDLRFYNKSLSQSEIIHLLNYNNGNSCIFVNLVSWKSFSKNSTIFYEFPHPPLPIKSKCASLVPKHTTSRWLNLTFYLKLKHFFFST